MTAARPRIVFMGTPEFAVPSLQILVDHGYEIGAVITVPDKPAGRGQQMKESAVKQYARSIGVRILQPEKLKEPSFLGALKEIKPDLQVVVAFRMLPESVWSLPPLGTFNLHASLLPQYRGAAPINWAVINGDAATGVTTFMLQHEIDTGNILFQEEVHIGETDTAGDVHDRLMVLGAGLVLKTVQAIESRQVSPRRQEELISPESTLRPAPKIFREHCQIHWNNPGRQTYNLIRGLAPYPGAWCTMQDPQGKTFTLKVYASAFERKTHQFVPGTLVTNRKDYFAVAARDGFISLVSVQLEGKKRLPVDEFLRGLPEPDRWKMTS